MAIVKYKYPVKTLDICHSSVPAMGSPRKRAAQNNEKPGMPMANFQ